MYTPDPQDTHTFRAYLEIEKAIADAKAHESYLTIPQLAMAIMAGLKQWGSDADTDQLASELLNLSHE